MFLCEGSFPAKMIPHSAIVEREPLSLVCPHERNERQHILALKRNGRETRNEEQETEKEYLLCQ